MVAVLILDKKSDAFKPLLDNESLSFLPVTVGTNLLGFFYSWINSYFSKDKIYVVCEKDEETVVIGSCSGISDENIIVEPKRISYEISVFYAALVIGKILPESRLFCFPINFLFQENFKMGSVIFAISEMVLKDWIVIPSILISKDENYKDSVIEGGKSLCNLKGVDFFEIDNLCISRDNLRKKKIFGKLGKNLNIISGKQKTIIDHFLKYNEEIFIKKLYNYFKCDNMIWDDIVLEYKNSSETIIDNSFFAANKNFLTIYLDTKVYFMNTWKDFLERFSGKDANLVSGKVTYNNCNKLVCLNYENDEIGIDSVRNTVILRKNGFTAIRTINQE